MFSGVNGRKKIIFSAVFQESESGKNIVWRFPEKNGKNFSSAVHTCTIVAFNWLKWE